VVDIPFGQLGEFIYHCHILDHEDGGMMAGIKVVRIPARAETGITGSVSTSRRHEHDVPAPLAMKLSAIGQSLRSHRANKLAGKRLKRERDHEPI